MKNWAWLLPCWVWKYFFAQFPKQRVLVDGRTRFLIRLDEEFALVYDPQGQAMLPKSVSGENENTPATEAARIFAPSKNRACIQADLEKTSSCEPGAYARVWVLARNVIKAAR